MEEILKFCSPLPYHNRAHTLAVVQAGKMIGLLSPPEQLAMHGHDILHTGKPRDGDEERSADVAVSVGVAHGIISPSESEDVKNLMLGTVFKNRGSLSGKQPLIADADISSIGKSFDVYLNNAARIFIEQCFSQNNIHPSRQEILTFWSQGQEAFFGYLTSITGDSDNPFLTKEAQKTFPNFKKNRDAIGNLAESNPQFLIGVIRTEWRKYFGFELVLKEEQV